MPPLRGDVFAGRGYDPSLVDPNVDDARLLKRNRLYGAAWPFVQDIKPGDTSTSNQRFVDFVNWAKANGFDDMGTDELEWAYKRAAIDSMF